ncbi:unnamed protein product [Ostreobium quekettii]|uniref:Uncharacterized protein n=1 Tax=Ostreobium quekettii TaxID=121088 RepID=A0A8S1IUM8_9CHLO|nr:unnamed protein product [Ostreobium quekettii]
MYGKRPAAHSPGTLLKPDVGDAGEVATADSEKQAKSVTKLQKEAELEDLNVDDAWLSAPPPDAYDMPLAGVRANKTKPHHRRTASRVLDDLPIMNPLFETAEEGDRGVSCPRLGAINWFEEGGVDVGEADYWEEIVDEGPKGGMRGPAFGGGVEKAKRVGGIQGGGWGKRGVSGGGGHHGRGRDGRGGIFPVNGVVERGQRAAPAAMRERRSKAAPSFPWRMFFYLAALLACSVAVEVVTDRGHRAMACGACVADTRDLARRLEQSRVEMLDRVGSMGMLLSNQALENHRLKEELVEAQRFTKYVQQGGRINVEREEQGTECAVEEDAGSLSPSPLEKFEADVHRAVWRFRYHVARLVGFFRKRLPVGTVMYERLRWLEDVVVGPIE